MRDIIKLALLMIPMLSGLNGLCQPPLPFPQGEAQWTVNYVFIGNSVPDRIYSTMGDTLVDGGQFTKIGWVENTNSPFGPEDLTYHGAMRDDGGQWLFIPASDSVEYVLYDFTGEEGDTVTIWNPQWGYGPADFSVQSVELMQFQDGPRRLWTLTALNGWLQSEYWVEGMGSLPYGLFDHAPNIADAGYMLICFEEDGLLIHRDPNADSCYYRLVGIEERSYASGELAIHPNPASKWIQIDLHYEALPPLVTIVFLDLAGRLVYGTSPIASRGQLGCDVSPLEPGTYLTVIIGDGVMLAYGRIVVVR